MPENNSEVKLDSIAFFDQFVSGDDQASDMLFHRYFHQLQARIQQRINPKLQSRVDADDILQSTYRTFFVHARNQDYVIERSGDLWKLLFAIARNKLSHQIERHTASKRDIQRETSSQEKPVEELSDSSSEMISGLLLDVLQSFLQKIDERDQLIMTSRMQGESTLEIAQQLNTTDRTVRRRLAVLQQQLTEHLA
ncbi:MAG: hypothetical protein COA78_07255 [Blastopirellula sp.]|nr:MAG: hypothetical protein COA78_07255 [Blastopirellula sp.]